MEILKFVDKADVNPDEVEAAREECIEAVMSRFGRSYCPEITYFLQIYIKILNFKYKKIELVS